MDALAFEHLIRASYKVERHGHKDADADIYRRYERAERLYQLEKDNVTQKLPRLTNQSLEELEYECRAQAIKIWTAITKAIKAAITEYAHLFSNSDISDLKELIIQPKELKKEDIENVINQSRKIFSSNKIYA